MTDTSEQPVTVVTGAGSGIGRAMAQAFARAGHRVVVADVDINLTGTFLVTKAVLPHMLERGSGAIVNTASEAGIRGGAAGIAYTASKHGVSASRATSPGHTRATASAATPSCPAPR